MINQTRALHTIAKEIKENWPKPYFGAIPYIQAMEQLGTINDNYYEDSADSIVIYFLSNAVYWRGDVARRIKKELREMRKDVR